MLQRHSHNGYKSKQRQIQNSDKSKTATTKTATNPKRRHAKTATTKMATMCMSASWLSPFWRVAVFGYNQNGDKSKMSTRLNSDNPAYPKRCVDLYPKRCMSPFWCVTVLDTNKHSIWERNQDGFVAVLACRRFGFGVSPFWMCRRLVVRSHFHG